MINPRIPLQRPFFDSDEILEIEGVLNSGWVSQGPKVKEFEDIVAKYLDTKYAVAVSNCTSALHLSLIALSITHGDEVLVADFTFPATAHAVLYCGAKPVFVDVDSRTYNMDPESIEEKISDKTKAIIPVHTFGQPAEMDRIMEIAESHDLKVIEDAACALGAKYKMRYAGTIGDIGCFSFHARKGITTGEGGMVVTNSKECYDRIRKLSVFGMTHASAWDREKGEDLIIPRFEDVGYNYKMSDIAAAIGVVQMRRIDRIITRKRILARYWDQRLDEIDHITSPFVCKDVEHVYQSYVVLVDKNINRNFLIKKLMDNGIQTQIGTYSCHIQPVYNSIDSCPRSLEIFNSALALPMYYLLEEHEIDIAANELGKSIRGLL